MSVTHATCIDTLADAPQDSDYVVITRVQAGRIHAFDTLVERYRNRLFTVIYNMTSNREDAADLLQDVFIKAFQSLAKFKASSSFYTWVYRIAINTTISHLRRQRLRRFFSFENIDQDAVDPELINALADKQASADKRVLTDELQLRLNEALQSLSLKHRTVVILAEIQGLSHAEIAEITKCSEGTVRSRLHYAKQMLQSLLQDYLR